jgi:hypothetical protein
MSNVLFSGFGLALFQLSQQGFALKSMLTCFNTSTLWMWNGLDILFISCSRVVFSNQ